MSLDSPQVSLRKPLIAVVGLSNRSSRPSHDVSAYMQAHGYRIIGINPQLAGTSILGEPCYGSLGEAQQALAAQGEQIAIVDCFRRAEDIPPVVVEAIAIGATCVWMQQGIVNHEAAARARAAGLTVIMDRCIKVDLAMGITHGVL
jgi:predicted CoA-binding protein